MFVAMLPAVAVDSPKPTATTANNAPSPQIVAYYFHGTVRCETCQKIEQQAKTVIEQQFKAGLDTHRLVFQPVNYDLPENTHFLLDYKLPCPSLVLVRQESGKDVKWKLLGQIWTLVETPTAFNQYIEKEVNSYLSELGNHADAAGTTNAPVKEPISESTPGKMVGALAELNVLMGDMNAAFVFVHATNGPSLINWVPMNRARRAMESEWDINLGIYETKLTPSDYRQLTERLPAFSLPAVMVILRNGTISMLSDEVTETNLIREFKYTVSIGGCCSLGNH